MKKYILSILFVVSIIAIGITVSAQNNVSSINVNVTVQNDGSAYVSQIWKGTFEEGTENYIPINTGDIEISGLKVSDQNTEYKTVTEWNVDDSFEEKIHKCGINTTDDGVELCFGISQYGDNTYTIEYTVHNLIKSYSDYDGTNFMFINPNMSTFPTDGKINIVFANGTKLSEENAGIWAFGFEGQIEFKDGGITAYTTSKLEDSNSMIVLLRLNKGVISPQKTVDKAFEDVKEKAMEGSSYNDGEISLWVKILFVVILIIVLLVIISLIKRKRAIKKFYKETQYFRDVPNKGNLEVSHFLAQTFDVAGEDSLIIGATLLSMINKHFIEPQSEESTGVFGKVKTTVNLKLAQEPDAFLEKKLYNIIKAAAGADGILQEKELKDYSYKQPKLLKEFVDGATGNGEVTFANNGGFTDGSGNCIKDLTDKGKTELAEIMGLKKYLTDFSLIAEREIKETTIWKDYLVYATLFGIADATIKQFRKIYPNMIQEIDDCNRNVIIAGSYYHTMHSSYQRAMDAQRNAGGGGSSSIGGGGGFSGGGFGGGSR